MLWYFSCTVYNRHTFVDGFPTWTQITFSRRYACKMPWSNPVLHLSLHQQPLGVVGRFAGYVVFHKILNYRHAQPIIDNSPSVKTAEVLPNKNQQGALNSLCWWSFANKYANLSCFCLKVVFFLTYFTSLQYLVTIF